MQSPNALIKAVLAMTMAAEGIRERNKKKPEINEGKVKGRTALIWTRN